MTENTAVPPNPVNPEGNVATPETTEVAAPAVDPSAPLGHPDNPVTPSNVDEQGEILPEYVTPLTTDEASSEGSSQGTSKTDTDIVGLTAELELVKQRVSQLEVNSHTHEAV